MCINATTENKHYMKCLQTFWLWFFEKVFELEVTIYNNESYDFIHWYWSLMFLFSILPSITTTLLHDIRIWNIGILPRCYKHKLFPRPCLELFPTFYSEFELVLVWWILNFFFHCYIKSIEIWYLILIKSALRLELLFLTL